MRRRSTPFLHTVAFALAATLTACGVPNVIEGASGDSTQGLGDAVGGPGGTGGPGATTGPGGPGSGPGLVPGATPPPGISPTDPSFTSIPTSQPTVAPGQPVPGSERGNGKGVSDRYIDIAFHMETVKCGPDGPESSQEPERIATYVRWFNKFVNLPGGRKLRYQIVDDGGPDVECQDKARAAGAKIANELKAFAALGYSTNPGADVPIVADVVTHNGTLHIGYNFNTHADFTKRAPYAWSFQKDGQTAFSDLVAYLEKRVKGSKYKDDTGALHDRSWGTLFFDSAEGRFLAEHSEAGLRRTGVAGEVKNYYMSGDTGTAAQQASSLALQMKQDGINSVVLGVHGAPAFASTQAFDAQTYHPDNFISDYGGYWFALFNDVYGQGQLARMSGIALPCVLCSRLNFSAAKPTDEANCPTCHQQDNGGAHATTYKEAGGTADNPDSGTRAGQHFRLLAMLVTGVLKAGPVLNPWTYQYGMFTTQKNRCAIERWYGRTHPQLPYYDFRPGKYWMPLGFTTLYWVAKPSEFGTHGYFESYDNYERFDDPARMPRTPTHDTGVKGFKLIVHKKTGLSPHTNC